MELTQEKSKVEDLNGLLWKQDYPIEMFDKERERALAQIPDLEFPTRRVENWKYTRTNKIINTQWNKADQAPSNNVDPYRIPNWSGSVLVFVNGIFQEDISEIKGLGEGIKIKPLSKACLNCVSALEGHFAKYTRTSNNIFDALNSASWQDGAFVYVPKGIELKDDVHVISLTTGDQIAVHTRNVFAVEESSKARIVLSVVSEGESKTYHNMISEVSVAKNAHLEIDKIQISGTEDFQMMTEAVDQAKDSSFSINTITVDAGWVRNDLKINVKGENCETDLYGVYLPVEHQHVDNHTIVDHQKPHCNSNEMYKGVIYDSAIGVFNGKVFVREDAQKTNAFQANNNIVMSENAKMNSKPELEIYADDVKCSHGSTTGQFDEEAVFYLRARGIGELNARKLLVGAFLSEALDNIRTDVVRSYVEDLLEKKQAEILSL
ncbi:MAG: Fe-S cluster assembly protein SufD [Flavobacteriales bacterium]|nr:Fe-S cluster assembly protein SufD [Flavobacteriales bacterium]